ncbi:hypothetical protein BRC83_00025 [Halobacteriales archaeon QS_1_68_17]|nr:MAG: hypothetical protein BRC83_00025 [Halobacteriales archaeon QS_1_68_17]
MGTDRSDGTSASVPPLEHPAYFSIDTVEGYVRIDQSTGNKPLYTPDEARDIAETILAAADEAEAESE